MHNLYYWSLRHYKEYPHFLFLKVICSAKKWFKYIILIKSFIKWKHSHEIVNMFYDIQICKTEMKMDFFMIFCPCKNNIVFASLNIWEIGFISFIRNLKCVSFLPFVILVCRFDKYALWNIFFKLWIWNKNLHEIEV